MSRRSTLILISALLTLALATATFVLWRHYTAEPSLAELHEQHPWAESAEGFEAEDHWLTVTDVKSSREGTVTVLGVVSPNLELPDRPGMIAAYSPGGRVWTPEFLDVDPTEGVELQYRLSSTAPRSLSRSRATTALCSPTAGSTTSS